MRKDTRMTDAELDAVAGGSGDGQVGGVRGISSDAELDGVAGGVDSGTGDGGQGQVGGVRG